MPKDEENIDNKELRRSKTHFLYVSCKACGNEMRHSPLIICSECLGDEVNKFGVEVSKFCKISSEDIDYDLDFKYAYEEEFDVEIVEIDESDE